MRIHTGQKLLNAQCVINRFLQSGNLKEHLRIKNVEKLFGYSICDKSVSEFGSLKHHIWIQTGKKQFSVQCVIDHF